MRHHAFQVACLQSLLIGLAGADSQPASPPKPAIDGGDVSVYFSPKRNCTAVMLTTATAR
jgi:hypothetical protein